MRVLRRRRPGRLGAGAGAEGLGDRRRDGRRGRGDSGLGRDSECGEHCEAWRQGGLWVCLRSCWEILPGLYIGNFKDARDAEQLSKNKVTHILSVHDSARPMLEGVKYLCIPAADSPSQNLTRHFKESIKFIHECRLQGEGCLVHRLAGVSRSVTLVVAYIMTVTDFGWEDALHTVRAGRSCANPNLGFQRQLQEFEELQVHQFRRWLREEYGESPLRDAEEARSILATPGILKSWPFLRRPRCT
ncbi:dual specificity protein phosphatase 22 isoform X2 [Oryx dammah]|uniref:dual specificity protein phosphatase 22 isoform X2 n=1 Tax=Oryx dammah TaxID=59534 RepID=UPI001A9A7579|nr:dual specificity protein phosphatase 22 isoform X2 [Oryx dammah]